MRWPAQCAGRVREAPIVERSEQEPIEAERRAATRTNRSRLAGSPSTRSPTMLRWISAVPPQIVSDREKKNDACRALTG